MAASVSELFSLREDQNGLRPVFLLGNERGHCSYACTFCGVGKSAKVTSEVNIQRFEKLRREYSGLINGVYHPVIFNKGNATNPEEFSNKTLRHVLAAFDGDSRVRFVSINCREGLATKKVLDDLSGMQLSYPIHFILGVESFLTSTESVIGKRNRGELERLTRKLKPYNVPVRTETLRKRYTFGLDANLLFLPELYLDCGESRENTMEKVKRGFLADLEHLLELRDPMVPIEINLHPYYRVSTLPYESADLDVFMALLPDLQTTVDAHNDGFSASRTHLFIGLEGIGHDDSKIRQRIAKWRDAVEYFNWTGIIGQGYSEGQTVQRKLPAFGAGPPDAESGQRNL